MRGGIRAVENQVGVLGLVLTALALACAALLISIYRELGQARNKLATLNEGLEEKVRERTAALTAQIAQRERAEGALRDERRFLQSVLDSLGEGIVTCNSDGELTLSNRAMREFHGLPDDQPVDRWQVCHFYPPSHVMIEVGVALTGKGGYHADAKDKVYSIVVDFITPETALTINNTDIKLVVNGGAGAQDWANAPSLSIASFVSA